jgi:hypothetical protein
MLRLQELKIGERGSSVCVVQCADRAADLADAALGEGSAAKLHKLSVKEIKHVRRRHACRSLQCSQRAAALRVQ